MQLKFESVFKHKKEVKHLYTEAFPKEERLPFSLLLRRTRQRRAKFYAVTDASRFVGLTLFTGSGDVYTLFFFAVCDDVRSKGYGSAILSEIAPEYKNKKLYICVEPVDENAANNAQRIKRKKFYLKNGFEECGFRVKEAGVEYDVMSRGGKITEDEYKSVTENFTGRFYYFFISRFL